MPFTRIPMALHFASRIDSLGTANMGVVRERFSKAIR